MNYDAYTKGDKRYSYIIYEEPYVASWEIKKDENS